MKIKIKQLDPDMPLPEYKTPGAVAFDIAVREEGIVEPGEIKLFATGLIICTPPKHALLLFNRSSNAKKRLVLANGVGVVDQDYCGPKDELYLALYNIGTKPYAVKKGERLGQGAFTPIPKVTFEMVDKMSSPTRGGFGTTG